MRKAPESGQAVVLVIVALGLFMFGALGLGIDGAQMYAQRQMAQTAADAAAQAAIMSVFRGTNSTSANPFSTEESFTCSVPPAALDLRTPCVYAQYNGFGTAADTVTVSFPSSITGVTLTTSVPAPAVSVTVQRLVSTALIRFLGTSASTIEAKASAGIMPFVPPTCLYVLDPSVRNAFTASNGVNVSMNCGIAINSSNATAATISGGAQVTASAVSIVGGYSINNGATISPSPTSGSQAAGDPMASVPAPTYASCDQTNYHPGSGNWTLNPGTYCGGITIDNGANASFNPGVYIVNGGTVHFGGGATITGSGVTFYLTGTNASYGSVAMDNGVTVSLSAPTSGTYIGLLFFQDRSITSSVSANFAGGASTQLTGTMYFPTTSVSFSNGSSASGNAAIVAEQVSFIGGTRLNYDPTGIKTGLLTKVVGLVE